MLHSEAPPDPMANLFELPRYIAVEGPIRVGKSTLSRVLAERLNAQRVMEPEDNPFLRAFYEGERGAAFQAQFAFLICRFEQLRALDLGARSQKTVVTDFIFDRNEDLQELLRKVSAPIKVTQYFLPLGSQEAASA